MKNEIVSRKEWLRSRKELLIEEKEFTKKRDLITQKIRSLPWVKVEKNYTFQTREGEKRFQGLFEKCSQLIVYHFMFDPEWEVGCKSCSFWADNFNGIPIHLVQRDVKFMAISRASLDKIEAYRKRMGWSFNWASSEGSDFSFDFDVSLNKGEKKNIYNYRETELEGELSGISVFYKNEKNEIFHTYSTYGRGLDIFNGAYNYLDIVPKGRDEQDLNSTMEWVNLKDLY